MTTPVLRTGERTGIALPCPKYIIDPSNLAIAAAERAAKHPLGVPSCVKDARERAYDAACQALARRLASHDAANHWRK